MLPKGVKWTLEIRNFISLHGISKKVLKKLTENHVQEITKNKSGELIHIIGAMINGQTYYGIGYNEPDSFKSLISNWYERNSNKCHSFDQISVMTGIKKKKVIRSFERGRVKLAMELKKIGITPEIYDIPQEKANMLTPTVLANIRSYGGTTRVAPHNTEESEQEGGD